MPAAGGSQERTIGVAIAVPEPYGTELQRWRRSFGDSLAASIPTHITLIPPTVVEPPELAVIEEHLGAVAAGERAFSVRLRGTGTFMPVSPVVFVALAAGAEACARIERRVRTGPLDRRPAFPYHPHVTVAHLRPDDPGIEDVLGRAAIELAEYEASFTALGFALYEQGPDEVWRPRRQFPFGGRTEGDRPSAVPRFG